jgi:hypothetical protein
VLVGAEVCDTKEYMAYSNGLPTYCCLAYCPLIPRRSNFIFLLFLYITTLLNTLRLNV